MPADELFVRSLRELMAAPVAAIRDSIHEQRSAQAFEGQLIEWMVDEQGWTHDPDKWEADVSLQPSSRLCLRYPILSTKRSGVSKTQLNILTFPPSPNNSARSQPSSWRCSSMKRAASQAIMRRCSPGIDRFRSNALLSDRCVEYWRRVLQHIEHFDLSKIDHDILVSAF